MDIQDMKNKIQAILDKTLPENFYKEVSICGGLGKSIAIIASPLEKTSGSFSQEMVSLCLWFWKGEDIELKPQVFSGYGGQSFIVNAEPGTKEAKLGIYARVKIPFRKPKDEEEKILSAVERFFARYLQALKDNKDRIIDPKRIDLNF